MKLAYYKSAPTNFGDELNAYMWPRLLPPGFLDEDESELFVGIGSILGEMFPAESRKFVVGSGLAGYFPPPDLGNGRWEIIFVRGPQTAANLGLAPETAICDSAILITEVADLPAPAPNIGIAFMPHFESLLRGNWEEVCRLAGIAFLDPTTPPEELLAKIRGARFVMTEAMHGAIVSDALRVPWVAIRPFHPSHRSKWTDWSDALGLELAWQTLWPSSPRELITVVFRRGGHRLGSISSLDSVAMMPVGAVITRLAARHLRRLAERAQPQLSSDAVLNEVTSRAKERVDNFVASQQARANVARPGDPPH
jgi:succinoglycan biosynthesis protein ExoV